MSAKVVRLNTTTRSSNPASSTPRLASTAIETGSKPSIPPPPLNVVSRLPVLLSTAMNPSPNDPTYPSSTSSVMGLWLRATSVMKSNPPSAVVGDWIARIHCPVGLVHTSHVVRKSSVYACNTKSPLLSTTVWYASTIPLVCQHWNGAGLVRPHEEGRLHAGHGQWVRDGLTANTECTEGEQQPQCARCGRRAPRHGTVCRAHGWLCEDSWDSVPVGGVGGSDDDERV